MLKRDLLQKLLKKYSYERSNSIIQIASENGVFEDNEVKVSKVDSVTYCLEWK